MLIRPDAEDFRVIGFYLGRIFLVVAFSALFPLGWAALAREWGPFSSFVLMTGVFALLGASMMRAAPGERRLDWSHGMVVVAVTWLVVPLIGSIPFILSGHFVSPLDAYFDAMSGITTTGLTLVQDLDHLAPSLNFWRHLLHFLAGQGIIIAALVLFAGGGAMTLYYGEARDDLVLPSVRSTARFIWSAALAHLLFGLLLLGTLAWTVLGFSWYRSLFHAMLLLFAAFDTGGFSPQSTSVGYYHSAIFELGVAVFMVAGAISFGIHFVLWRGPRRELLRNFEMRTILLTTVGTLSLTILGLATIGLYGNDALAIARQSLFQVLSAHSGTGFSTVPSSELARWGGLAFGGMTLAMGLGGMASSTAGGVKSLRVGLVVRAVFDEIRSVLLPHGAIIDRSYHQFQRRVLTDALAKSVMTVSLLYAGLYLLGAGVALGYGIPMQDALFESTSAAANVGLSVGVTHVGMPPLLEIVYILEMWMGRLEFVAAFAFFGFLWSLVRGK